MSLILSERNVKDSFEHDKNEHFEHGKHEHNQTICCEFRSDILILYISLAADSPIVPLPLTNAMYLVSSMMSQYAKIVNNARI